MATPLLDLERWCIQHQIHFLEQGLKTLLGFCLAGFLRPRASDSSVGRAGDCSIFVLSCESLQVAGSIPAQKIFTCNSYVKIYKYRICIKVEIGGV